MQFVAGLQQIDNSQDRPDNVEGALLRSLTRHQLKVLNQLLFKYLDDLLQLGYHVHAGLLGHFRQNLQVKHNDFLCGVDQTVSYNRVD